MDQLSKALELTEDAEINDEKDILEGIVRFSNIAAIDIIRPRINIIALDIEDSFEVVKNVVIEHGYSRLPVYRENLDTIEGILYVKDLLAHLKEPQNFAWQSLIRPAYFVPETKKINDLLEEFQVKKVHMAIIVDEYGGTSGIVTMEDILEEIVGNIFDEYDDDDDDIALAGHGYIVGGRAELDELSEHLGIEFPDEDFQTLNGFMLYELGRLPYENEKIDITYKGYNFETIGIKDKMIDKVRITKVENENQV